jgi:NAD(P)-dependent dehydrogenase (short-subunit alcohol dehydrogenase family)
MTTVVLTGANQGLGLAVVDRAARRLGPRADLYLTWRNPDRARAAADRLERAGQTVPTAVPDVTDGDAVEALAAELAERHGQVDSRSARYRPPRPSRPARARDPVELRTKRRRTNT